MIKHDNIYSDLITIIIPTYNSGLYLKESLESLKLQKKKARILIADGNSDDNSLEIINKFEKDLDIKIISKSDNGQSDALNKMINLVNTPYFLWFNSDDYLCPDAVYEFENFLYNSRLEYPMVSLIIMSLIRMELLNTYTAHTNTLFTYQEEFGEVISRL